MLKVPVVNYLWNATLLFIALVVAQSAHAQSTPQITKDGKVERIAYATELLVHIKKIDDQIPTLSPSETAWLKAESAECERVNNFKRCSHLWKSKENALGSVKQYFISLKKFLADILHILSKSDLSSADEHKEVLLWSLVGLELSSTNLWVDLYALVEEFKVLGKEQFLYEEKRKMDLHLFIANNGKIPSEQIQKHIVIPLLSKYSH